MGIVRNTYTWFPDVNPIESTPSIGHSAQSALFGFLETPHQPGRDDGNSVKHSQGHGRRLYSNAARPRHGFPGRRMYDNKAMWMPTNIYPHPDPYYPRAFRSRGIKDGGGSPDLPRLAGDDAPDLTESTKVLELDWRS